jgi:hypothetical protein
MDSSPDERFVNLSIIDFIFDFTVSFLCEMFMNYGERTEEAIDYGESLP